MGIVKNIRLWHTQNGSFPLPLPEAQRDFFFRYSLWEIYRILVGKTWRNVLPTHNDRVFLEFLLLRFVYSEPPTIHQLHLGSPYHNTVFHRGTSSCKLWLWYPPSCLSNILGNSLPCDCTPLMGIRRVPDSSVYSTFLLVMMKWWLVSSFTIKLETRSPQTTLSSY